MSVGPVAVGFEMSDEDHNNDAKVIPQVINAELLRAIRAQYRCDWGATMV
mgnify:CR=1 FL=1